MNPRNWIRSLMIAAAFAGMILLDEYLAVYVPAMAARLTLVLGFTFVAGFLWRQYRASLPQSIHTSIEGAHTENITTLDVQAISEITTALEHLRSVRLLLEISNNHGQPLPRAVPLNLELVIKHLDRARERFRSRELVDTSLNQIARMCVDGPQSLATHK